MRSDLIYNYFNALKERELELNSKEVDKLQNKMNWKSNNPETMKSMVKYLKLNYPKAYEALNKSDLDNFNSLITAITVAKAYEG